ncbi:MAG: translation elongation factor Ts [Bacillota bacterium]
MVMKEVIKQLREKTGVGVMECKRALALSNSDIDVAISYLREKGIVKANEKSNRPASEGIIHSYIHGDGRTGVLVEVNVETDFAAKSEKFRLFVKEIGLQIAASNPRYIRREDIPLDIIEVIKGEFITQSMDKGKTGPLLDRIVEGKMEKFYQDVCLMDQVYAKDPEKTVKDIVTETVLSIGENIIIRRFIRYEMGKCSLINEFKI